MKGIITYYLLELLICFIIGLIIALMKFYSGWFIIALIFPLSFGWIPFAEINQRMKEHFNGALVFTILAFLLLIGILVLCALVIPDESFLAVTLGSGLFCAIIITLVLLLRIRAIQRINVIEK